MSIEQRLKSLEADVAYQAAIIDGSEMQTREAVVAVVGLLIAHLAGKGTVHYDDLIKFLGKCADPDDAVEDHVGQMINDLRRIVDFHRRDESGEVEPYVPISERLTVAERNAAIETARAELAATKAAEQKPTKRTRKTKVAEPTVY
jgi:hypothetical protein